jgi:hypothetical protein
MAMEEPHARVISVEAEHGVSAGRDLDCVAEDGTGEIIRLLVRVRMLYAGWNLVRERVVRTPADRGLVDGQDEEVMAVLGSVSDP